MSPGIRTFFTSLIVAGIVLVANGAPAQPVDAQAALPALPARWPSNSVQIGVMDSPGGAAAMRATAPFGFRYQYLAGGVPGGWATWNANGAFATYYIQDSINNGMTPTFTYYMLRQ